MNGWLRSLHELGFPSRISSRKTLDPATAAALAEAIAYINLNYLSQPKFLSLTARVTPRPLPPQSMYMEGERALLLRANGCKHMNYADVYYKGVPFSVGKTRPSMP